MVGGPCPPGPPVESPLAWISCVTSARDRDLSPAPPLYTKWTS